MSTFATNLRAALDAISTGLRDDREKWVAAQEKANSTVPYPGRSPAMARDLKWAFKLMKDIELPHYFSHSELRDAEMNAIDRHIADMRSLPEFDAIKTKVIDVHWTSKPILVNDKINPATMLCRVKVVPKEERETWPSGEDAPDYRILVSFPFWALCDIEGMLDLLDRQLHAALCLMSGGAQNKIRRPDISGHAATFGRFGTLGPLETRAVLNASKHRKQAENVDRYMTQGWLFDPIEARQGELPLPPEPAEKPVAQAIGDEKPRGRGRKQPTAEA